MNPALFMHSVSGSRKGGVKTIEPFTPLQYVIGKANFCGLEFIVDERVFIPRPETELLVQKAIDISHQLPITNYQLRILDLCAGSGNIAITLTKNIPDCRIVASDVCDEALEVAAANARLKGASDRIKFVKGDLFENLEGKFDMIVSNPPYVARYEFDDLQKEVRFEPRIALDGGEDGLDFYRRIAKDAPRYLKKNGYLIMEIGYGQFPAIREIIEKERRFSISEIFKDHNGIDRVIVTKWTQNYKSQIPNYK